MSENTNPYETPTSNLASPPDVVLSRRDLVPLWIKVIGWLFIALGIMSIPVMLWGAVTGEDIRLELFGFRHVGPALTLYAVVMVMLNLFMGLTAYGLIFRKNWGVTGCLANGYLGLALCVLSMFLSGFANLRLEPIIQLFYLRRLHKIRPEWDKAGPSHEV